MRGLTPPPKYRLSGQSPQPKHAVVPRSSERWKVHTLQKAWWELAVAQRWPHKFVLPRVVSQKYTWYLVYISYSNKYICMYIQEYIGPFDGFAAN